MSLNRVTIMGRMTKDPELRTTPAGVSVASFSIAVDRDFRDKQGEKQTDFFDVTAWRGTAEFISRNFGKGRMIVVDGRLQMRKWTDKDGNTRTAAEILAENVYFGDSKPDSYRNNIIAPSEAGFTELSEGDGDGLPF